MSRLATNPAAPAQAPTRHAPGAAGTVARVWRELLARQRTLTIFAAILLVAMVPAAVMLGIDDRELRGVSVWVKPLKFMLSIAVLAVTTAWFMGDLRSAARRSTAARIVVGLVIGMGTFEAVYITLQSALGQASHYNDTDAFHAVMYTLMGVGALLLTASQPLLAWLLHRDGQASLAPAYALSVKVGLVLTFALGAGVGMLLGGLQPPTGASLPILGWSTVAGDLRPAHFVGIHAEQVLPLAGALLVARGTKHASRWVWAIALVYAMVCIGLVVQALLGVPLVRG